MIEYIEEEKKLKPWKERRHIEKKILPEYYAGIRSRRKMFEIRKDDDDIQPGDILILREWDGKDYTGAQTRREVTAILRDAPELGLKEDFAIFSLQTAGWDGTTTQGKGWRS